MLEIAESHVGRIRHKCAYIANNQYISSDFRPAAAAVLFSALSLLKEKATESKKPYVSVICKAFSFFEPAEKCNRKQVLRDQLVTNWA